MTTFSFPFITSRSFDDFSFEFQKNTVHCLLTCRRQIVLLLSHCSCRYQIQPELCLPCINSHGIAFTLTYCHRSHGRNPTRRLAASAVTVRYPDQPDSHESMTLRSPTLTNHIQITSSTSCLQQKNKRMTQYKQLKCRLPRRRQHGCS